MKSNAQYKQTEIGEIPEDWEIRRLDEVCLLQRGFDLPSHKRIEGSTPIYASNGIVGWHNIVKVKAPGVVTGRSGKLGNSFYVDQDFWPLNTTLWVKEFKNSDPYFVYLLLGRLRFEEYNAGSSVPTLNRNHIHSISVAIPKLREQEEIGNFIKTIDDKIELNRRMNKTLEEMGKALFKRWFVDFEFPNENGEPYKSCGGEMADSELGEIPKGWKVSKLEEIIDITSGKRPENKSETSSDENRIPIIGASGIMGFTSNHLYDEKIICTGRVGTLGVVQKINYPCWMSDNTLVIKSDFYEFVYFTLSSIDFSSYNVGSTQPLITQSSIKNIKIVHPHNELLNQFEEAASVLTLQNISNRKEIGSIEGIRDSLLPRLMSGKIRV